MKRSVDLTENFMFSGISRHISEIERLSRRKVNLVPWDCSKGVYNFETHHREKGSFSLINQEEMFLSNQSISSTNPTLDFINSDEKLFNNVIMEIKIVQSLPMEPGDKMSDSYGGKGVVSEIRPDNLMPVLENGTVVEVIKNQSTCINRENLGQLHEQSLTFIGSRFIDYFKLGVLSPCEMCYLWYDFVSMLDKEFADFMKDSVNFDNEYSARIFIESILEDDAII